MEARDVRFGFKVGQIRPKWDKSGNIFRSDSVHFGSSSRNVLNLIWKYSRICRIWSQSEPFWALFCHSWVRLQGLNPFAFRHKPTSCPPVSCNRVLFSFFSSFYITFNKHNSAVTDRSRREITLLYRRIYMCFPVFA